jgi:integrase
VGRTHDPWPRGGPGGPWYATIRGKQVRLADGKATKSEARRILIRILATESPQARSQLTMGDVIDRWLVDCRRRLERGEMAANTLRGYLAWLESADRAVGSTMVVDFIPHQAQEWLDGQKWAPSTRSAAGRALRTATRWARDAGLIQSDPLAAWKPPPMRRRKVELPPDLVPRLLAECKREGGREFVLALAETGCRPSEVAAVTAAHVDLVRGVWRLSEHKTGRKTGRDRVVYLSPAMLELTARLVKRHPTGALFRTLVGTPWTRATWTTLFRRIRARTGMNASAVTLRHHWITQALARGVPTALVAELAGHTTARQIESTYGHLDQRAELLRAAILRATDPGVGSVEAGPAGTASDTRPRPAARSESAAPKGRRGRR